MSRKKLYPSDVIDLQQIVRRRFKELTENRPDLTLAKIAEGLDVDQSMPTKMLNGSRPISLEMTGKIARFFSVSVGWLLEQTDRAVDPQTATLLGAWDRLKDDPPERIRLLKMVLLFVGDEPGGSGTPPAGGGGAPHTRPTDPAPPRSKRRA